MQAPYAITSHPQNNRHKLGRGPDGKLHTLKPGKYITTDDFDRSSAKRFILEVVRRLKMTQLFNNLVRVYGQRGFKDYSAHVRAFRDLGRILAWMPPEKEHIPYAPTIYYEVDEDTHAPSGCCQSEQQPEVA